MLTRIHLQRKLQLDYKEQFTESPKRNEIKTIHINFTNKRGDKTKYLGISLNAKLRWKEHIKQKHVGFQLQFKKNILAPWMQVRAFYVQKVNFIQTGFTTSMDVRHPVVGLCKQRATSK